MSTIVINKNFSFDHSVGVLTRAYLSGNLQRNNCSACAVGNLIADAMHIELTRTPTHAVYDGVPTAPEDHYFVDWVGSTTAWFPVIIGTEQEVADDYSGREQIMSTGYTIDQLGLIEDAFEQPREITRKDPAYDEYIYRGLLAVVDVLAEIHGIDFGTSERAGASITLAYAQLSAPAV